MQDNSATQTTPEAVAADQPRETFSARYHNMQAELAKAFDGAKEEAKEEETKADAEDEGNNEDQAADTGQDDDSDDDADEDREQEGKKVSKFIPRDRYNSVREQYNEVVSKNNDMQSQLAVLKHELEQYKQAFDGIMSGKTDKATDNDDDVLDEKSHKLAKDALKKVEQLEGALTEKEKQATTNNALQYIESQTQAIEKEIPDLRDGMSYFYEAARQTVLAHPTGRDLTIAQLEQATLELCLHKAASFEKSHKKAVLGIYETAKEMGYKPTKKAQSSTDTGTKINMDELEKARQGASKTRATDRVPLSEISEPKAGDFVKNGVRDKQAYFKAVQDYARKLREIG
jgi:hypothetical protein